MLEDESGRLRIGGTYISTQNFVTGCVIGALGSENSDGIFNVIETVCADLPRQPQRWERDDSEAAVKTSQVKQKREKAGKLAIVSGLGITGTTDEDIALDLLLEYLTGELGGPAEHTASSAISRLMIAGNSLLNSSPIPSREEFAVRKAAHKRHYGYDSTTYNSDPVERLDQFLADVLPQLPVTLLPGSSDPASVAIPQQPLHPALFPLARQYANPPIQNSETRLGLDSVTNPWDGDIEGWRVLGTSGQTVDDLMKYVDNSSTLDVMDMMLRWRCVAPTAPDTLCTYFLL